jgi:hypothetical protein
VFNNIYFEFLLSLTRPAAAADRSGLVIAGDSDSAKAQVTAFLNAIGYDAVDAGPLAYGRAFQPDTPPYGLPYGGRSQPVPVSAASLRALLELVVVYCGGPAVPGATPVTVIGIARPCGVLARVPDGRPTRRWLVSPGIVRITSRRS